MGYNNENNLASVVVELGSISSATTKPALYLTKRAILKSAYLIDGAGVAAQYGSSLKVELQNQDDEVLAKVDTLTTEEGALTINVGKALEILEEEIASGSSLKTVYSEVEGVAEITRITVPAEMVGADLDGTGFLIYDDVGSVDVWFDPDNGGTTEPANLNTAGARAIEVNTIGAADDAEAIATALAAVLDSDSKFVAVVDPDDATSVLVTSSTVGIRTDASDGLTTEASGLEISVDTEGADAVAQALTNAKLILNLFYP